MGHLTQWRSILVHHVDRFAAGTDVEFPIISTTKTPAGELWFFGKMPDLDDNGFPRDVLGSGAFYQGRVKFLNPDNEFEVCSFIVSMPPAPQKIGPAAVPDPPIPRVFGEHMLSHVFDEAGIRPPNENPDVLARWR
jgi:hypothetical protein